MLFAGYAQDREFARFLTWRPHRCLAETEAYVARWTAAPRAGRVRFFFVELRRIFRGERQPCYG
jgi:hypothetical protein